MRLTFFQRVFSYLTIILLFLSGLVWLLFNFFIDYDSPFRFLSIWSLRLHGAAAYALLIVFGMIISTHISFNWRVKKNRRKSGIILTAFLAILIVTGCLLYYLGDEEIRSYVSYIHWIIGIIFSIIFLLHGLTHKKPSDRGLKTKSTKI
ncbi:MAG: DUF4405 domain-containing protein [Proteobacteria bacterium]|nr:DUF4405 domain-containing protein [Pseudomonadota bacterium]